MAARGSTGVWLGAFALQVGVLGLWSWVRGINADEGFYLEAGRSVADGLAPYRDFFFPQMPYYAWLLGGLFRLTEPGIGAGRALAVLGAGLSASLLGWTAWKTEPSSRVVAGALFLYTFSAVLLYGLSVTKAAPLVNACLLAAFAPLVAGRGARPGWSFVAGLAAGAAIGLRLAAAPATLLFACFAARRGRRALAAYALGGVVGSLPWLWCLTRSADEFWFCNVTFHSLRREISGVGPILGQKARVLARWFFLPQHLVLWSLFGVGLWSEPRRAWPAAAAALVLAVTYAAATPTYLEYLTQVIPFAILAAVPAIACLVRRRWLCGAIAAAYLAGVYPLFKPPAPGSALAAERALWSRRQVAEVSEHLRHATAPGATVLSWWEGYPVLSGRRGFRGVGFWESNVAKKLDPEEARRYHVVGRQELEAIVARREPDAIVVADGQWQRLRPAIESGYALSLATGAVRIYLRRGNP